VNLDAITLEVWWNRLAPIAYEAVTTGRQDTAMSASSATHPVVHLVELSARPVTGPVRVPGRVRRRRARHPGILQRPGDPRGAVPGQPLAG
jgi:hypothetical protein